MIQAAKIIGTGLATTGLIGAGVGMEGYYLGYIVLACLITLTFIGVLYFFGLFGHKTEPVKRCRNCALRGLTVWVTPGSACRYCGTVMD